MSTRSSLTEQEANQCRRKDVVSCIYNLWTANRSDLSGLAPAFFDGRVDTISHYVLADAFNCNQNHELNASDGFQDEVDNKDTTSYIPVQVDRVRCEDLTYDDFVSYYMENNFPVIIDGLADDWKAVKEWVVDAADDDVVDKNTRKLPNVANLRRKFGTSKSAVFEQDSYGFDAVLRRPSSDEMTICDYMDWWEHYHRELNCTKSCLNKSTISNGRHNSNEAKNHLEQFEKTKSLSFPLLYLKDWKFVTNFPNYDAYQCPKYFSDDWLNDAMGNAYKFVYLGPAGTTTVLHADVVRSYSWSTNVCGKKRWFLIPPASTYLLYDTIAFGGTTLATHLHLDLQSAGIELFYPGLKYARQHAIEIIQDVGETLFVPTNWFHTVENLEPTLSINHNWINGTNIVSCWHHIESEIRSLRIDHNTGSRDNEISQTGLVDSNTVATTTKVGEEMNNFSVDDDVLLLWHIIVKKVNRLNIKESCEFEQMSRTTQMDIKVILYILDRMSNLISDGICPALGSEVGRQLEFILRKLKLYF